MYIVKNALRCITRSKGRNFLIGLVVLLISVSSCIGLSIKQANKTLKQQYADDMEITASLMKSDMKNGESISLETLKEYSEQDTVKNFYYTSDIYFAAGEGIEPLDVAGSFKQNKDFKEKYGDIKSGDKKTTTSTGSTTVTTSEYTESDDEADTGNAYLTLNTKIDTNTNTDTDTTKDTKKDTDPNLGESESEPNKTDGDDTSSRPLPDNSDNSDNGAKDDFPKDEEKTDGTVSDGDNAANSKPADTTDDTTPPQKPSEDAGNDKTSSADKTDSNTKKSTFDETPPEMPDGETPPDDAGQAGNEKGERRINRKTIIQGGDTVVNNQFFFNMASMNDFTLRGYTQTSSLPEYVSTLGVLDLESDEYNCVISENLAEENSLKTGDTFTLANPDNSEEIYKFTIVGICDTSESTESSDTSSNASFSDNVIYTSSLAVEKIAAASAKSNTSDSDDESSALTPAYSGTYTFKNLTDYNTFSENIADDYSVISTDAENYETGVSQLETLGNYATYFLAVIFAIGGFVLVVINVFSIRDRKYEIGVLTAMGMKKGKVAMQFLCELFIVTFIALTIGSTAGAITSVPVTNKLLTAVNSTETSQNDENRFKTESGENSLQPDDLPDKEFDKNDRGFGGGNFNNYIASVSSATNLTVILQMVGVGLALTVISSLAAIGFVMRYEPLKILSSRD